jgi:gliding motility-associated-like protein
MFKRILPLIVIELKGKNKLLVWCFMLFLTFDCFAQQEQTLWYFGEESGIDFSSGSPSLISNGELDTDEGSAVMSDNSGNLLFYTEGSNVWDKNHNIMPNGSGLFGHSSSTQTAVIVPLPSSSKYYIFTTTFQGSANGLNYSIVDMSLNGGNGDVTTKNLQITTPVCEKVIAVQHANCDQYWIIVSAFNSSSYYAYLLSPSGLDQTPVVSNVGLYLDINFPLATTGQMSINADLNKVAVTYGGTEKNVLHVYDFDNVTGVLSNTTSVNVTMLPYGINFSPDGNLIYVTEMNQINQYDISSGIASAIQGSRTTLGTYGTLDGGYIQLGPDGKLYVAIKGEMSLAIIQSPNNVGASCNYVQTGFNLGGKESKWGLPNFVYKRNTPLVPPTPITFLWTDTCTSLPTNFSINGSTIGILSWNFGDVNSPENSSSLINPDHTYTTSGSFNVTLDVQETCDSYQLSETIWIDFCDTVIDSLPADTIINPNDTIIDPLPTDTITDTTPTDTVVTIIDPTEIDTGDVTSSVEDFLSVYIPNSFTPNFDGNNDLFFPVFSIGLIKTYEFLIFNRWGELLFQTNNIRNGWSGTFKSKKVPAGVYIYKVLAISYKNVTFEKTGKLNLLR